MNDLTTLAFGLALIGASGPAIAQNADQVAYKWRCVGNGLDVFSADGTCGLPYSCVGWRITRLGQGLEETYYRTKNECDASSDRPCQVSCEELLNPMNSNR